MCYCEQKRDTCHCGGFLMCGIIDEHYIMGFNHKKDGKRYMVQDQSPNTSQQLRINKLQQVPLEPACSKAYSDSDPHETKQQSSNGAQHAVQWRPSPSTLRRRLMTGGLFFATAIREPLLPSLRKSGRMYCLGFARGNRFKSQIMKFTRN